jgi:hypothetical protein
MMSPRTEVTPPTPERPTHDRDTDGAAPPPPPKDDVNEKSERDSVEPKMQTEEQKARTEDLKPQSETEKQQVDSEEDDSEPEPSDEKALEASLPQRPKPGQASAEDDDDGASFQEVQL